jgi:membrane-bound serine protease (ClpP class)
MNSLNKKIVIVFAGLLIFLSAISSFALPTNKVYLIELNDDTINPVTAEYISQGIDKAHEANAQCLIIKLDTPGGLLSSTRTIVKKILSSKVPVVVYIAPSGSHAGSAGVFITYASHVAAMAPSTNIGAAHPVQMGDGGQPKSKEIDGLRELVEELKAQREKREKIKEEKSKENSQVLENKLQGNIPSDESPMESKILQDTVAFIKAIAQERGRNIEWAIESVTKSSSITETEALDKGVVEIIAQDEKELLQKLDGRIVEIGNEKIVLATKESSIERVEMDFRQVLFNGLANPNIVYFLMILGFYGLLYELTHPGFGLPGILGGIFLVLSFYGMQTLPTNYAALILIVLGLGLLVAEVFTPGIGILSFGGISSLFLGSLLLFQSADPVMRVSLSLILTLVTTTAALILFLLGAIIRTRKLKVRGGKEGLIGETGEAKTVLGKNIKGKVFVQGALWNASSQEDIKEGEEVVVLSLEGLNMEVKKK